MKARLVVLVVIIAVALLAPGIALARGGGGGGGRGGGGFGGGGRSSSGGFDLGGDSGGGGFDLGGGDDESSGGDEGGESDSSTGSGDEEELTAGVDQDDDVDTDAEEPADPEGEEELLLDVDTSDNPIKPSAHLVHEEKKKRREKLFAKSEERKKRDKYNRDRRDNSVERGIRPSNDLRNLGMKGKKKTSMSDVFGKNDLSSITKLANQDFMPESVIESDEMYSKRAFVNPHTMNALASMQKKFGFDGGKMSDVILEVTDFQSSIDSVVEESVESKEDASLGFKKSDDDFDE